MTADTRMSVSYRNELLVQSGVELVQKASKTNKPRLTRKVKRTWKRGSRFSLSTEDYHLVGDLAHRLVATTEDCCSPGPHDMTVEDCPLSHPLADVSTQRTKGFAKSDVMDTSNTNTPNTAALTIAWATPGRSR